VLVGLGIGAVTTVKGFVAGALAHAFLG